MNLKSGYPYFLMKNGLGEDFDTLQSDEFTEVVVLGGGISGALMAHSLIRNRIECIILDKRSIGLGSSSASTSLLQYEIDVPLHLLARQIGKESAIRAYTFCSEAIDRIKDISNEIGFKDFKYCSSVYFSDASKKSDYLRKEFEIRKEAGFDVEFLSEAEILQRYNFKSKEAILSSKAATTDAYLFTHSLIRYNLKKGLRVFENNTVTNIEETSAGVELQTDKGYRVKAKKIIYATGFEVTEQISKSIVKLKSTYAFVTEHLKGLPSFFEGTVLWNTSDPYLYIREDKGRLIVGGRDEKYYDPEKRDALLEKKAKKLEEDFRKLFPEIDFRPQFSWAGTFGSTKDGLPYIGSYSKKPNSYFALGFGGNGITFSALAADLISGQIRDKSVEIPEMFRFNR